MDEIVKIELFGEEFKFKPDKDQAEDPVKIAAHVQGYIDEAESLFKNKSSSKNKMAILLLAVMNLSTDYHKLQTAYSDLENDIENRVSSLLEKIDKTMK
ncbi:MAG: cell division protein ZapA [Desulfobacterales bacterium]|nr:cell division protein ZapA [Desulfobacterales bacterium]